MGAGQSLLYAALLVAAQHMAGQSFSYLTISDPNAFSYTQGFGMNDAGQVVGSEDAGGAPGGFLYSKGTFTPINTPLGTTYPCSINNRERIVGYYIGPTATGTNEGEHGFLYRNGTFREFDAFGSANGTIIFGINNRGVFVGTYTNDQGQITSFISNGKSTKPVHIRNSQQTQAQGINDLSHIAGSFTDASGDHSYAFLYANGHVTALTYPGARQTWGSALNDLDEVVGTYLDSSFNTHGFLYRSGQYFAIDVPGAAWTEPSGINNAGQIVGSYTLTDPLRTYTFIATQNSNHNDRIK